MLIIINICFHNIFKASKSYFSFLRIFICINIRVTLIMEQKKSIQEIKRLLGVDKIHPELNGREKLERMIDPNKYYLVSGYILPFKGSTILKRNFQPILIKQDLGYYISKEEWQKYNELKEQQLSWIQQPQQQTEQD